jgi:hypothetical protein
VGVIRRIRELRSRKTILMFMLPSKLRMSLWASVNWAFRLLAFV